MAKRRRTIAPAVVEVGVPRLVDDEKTAAETPGIHYPESMRIAAPEQPGLADRLLGRTSINKSDKPWYYTAAIGGPALGLYGGYKLIDKLLDSRHKQEREDELERAKEEYRQALVSQYTSDQVKGASVTTIADDLDKLANRVKLADVNDWINHATGTYLPLAALLAGGAGLATYNWTKSRSPEERLIKAIKQREKLRWAARPPEIYAVAKPVPVRVAGSKDAFNTATPEDEDEVRKIASLYHPQG